MSNYQEEKLENITIMHIPGKNLTWRHMEDRSNGEYHNGSNARYFAIKLDEDHAEELEALGWPVTWYDVNRNKENEPELLKPHLKVFLKFGTRFPIDVYLVNSNMKQKTPITENDIDNLHLDNKPIDFIDVVIRPYYWVYGNKNGIKAQVQVMNIMLSQTGIDDGYEIVYPTE